MGVLMTGTDTGAWLFDIRAGLGLLTRLPVRVDPARAAARGGAAAWAWPLTGVVVGLIGAGAGGLAFGVGAAAPVAAALAIAAQVVVTGALHEDGLADTADGFWGGWDKARRLAIMKDSHIGTYGVLALLLVTLIRWSALTALFQTGAAWTALIVAGVLSRAPMAIVMAALPNARGSGLSQAVGRPSRGVAANGATLAAAVAVLVWGPGALGPILAAALVTMAVIRLARARIGGQTGDVLGATQQVAEATVLILLAS
jgi:adenosylcobinamide-GDP ribazoletransferase